MNFVKLKNKIVIEQYETNIFRTSYGNKINGQFKGIEYFITETINQTFLNIIPERYRKDFAMLTMRINTKVPPHTDSGILTSINCYIKTDNCVTKFYKIKEAVDVKITKLKNQTNGSIFDILSLDYVDEFKAEPYEIYLLDVTKPHAVVSTTGIYDQRLAVCLQSDIHRFDAVRKMLIETGNL